MSSKFFAQSDSDSYSDSLKEFESAGCDEFEVNIHKKPSHGFFALSDESLTESSEESLLDESAEQPPVQVQTVKKPGFFDITSSEESEDDSQKKTVKSQSQKLKDEILSLFVKIESSLFEQKWIHVQELFDDLTKKKSKFSDAEINEKYNNLLEDIEEDILSSQSGKLVMKLEAKAIFALKQKIRKLKQAKEESLKQSLTLPEIKLSSNINADEDNLKQKKIVKRELSEIEITSTSVFEVMRILRGSHSKKSNFRAEGLLLMRSGFELCIAEKKIMDALYVLYNIIGFELEFPFNLQSAKEISKDFKTFSEMYCDEFLGRNFEDDGFSEVKDIPEQQSKLPILGMRFRDELNKLVNVTDHHSSEFGELLFMLDGYARALELILKKTTDYKDVKIPLAVLLIEVVHCHPRPQEFTNLSELFKLVYSYGSSTQKIECALMNILMLAKSDRYLLAKNLWLHMRIGDFIAENNVRLGIFYNRTLAYLGLSAFKSGNLRDAYFLLQEICSSGKPKELLGQQILNPSHAPLQVPYYMHINIEVLDAVFSISSFILECPQLSFNDLINQLGSSADLRKSINYQCRHLKRLLDFHDRSIYSGPPENTRESIILAAKNLLRGDFINAYLMLSSLRIWKMISNSDKILKMLESKINHSKSIISEIDGLWSNSDISISFANDLATFDARMLINREPDIVKKMLSKLNESSSYFGEEDFKEISQLRASSISSIQMESS